ncbi:MAG: ribokinase [Acholeplasmataceae bacterium]|jgi:ribokinase|nr:ribokinase [Acholeplasmataceae bacterium]
MKNIFVYGSLNTDFTLELPKKIKMGETLKADKLIISFGGKGANQAYAAKKMGGEVYMLGDVGNDIQGKSMIKNLAEIGIRTEGISIHKEEKSGIAMITLFDQNNEIIVYPGANLLSKHQKVQKVLNQFSHVYDYFVFQFEKKLMDIETTLHMARSKKLYTVCNPSPMDKAFVLKIAHHIDLLVINETEYETITEKPFDYHAPMRNLNELHMLGFMDAIITMGEHGVVAVIDSYKYLFKAPKVEVVDTTGAGDTFLGSYISLVSQGYEVKDALEMATKAASISVTQYGAQTSMPSKKDMDT